MRDEQIFDTQRTVARADEHNKASFAEEARKTRLQLVRARKDLRELWLERDELAMLAAEATKVSRFWLPKNTSAKVGSFWQPCFEDSGCLPWGTRCWVIVEQESWTQCQGKQILKQRLLLPGGKAPRTRPDVAAKNGGR